MPPSRLGLAAGALMTSCLLLSSCGGDSGSAADGFIQVGNPPAPIGVGVSPSEPAEPAKPAEQPAPATAKPAAKPAAQPAAKSVTQPAASPAAKPSAQPAAKPATQPAAKAATQPKTQPPAPAPEAKASTPSTPKASAPVAKSKEKIQPKPKTAAPAKTKAAAPARVASKAHKVARGDTLYGIAKQYGIAVSQLLMANPGTSADRLAPGQVLTIPPLGEPGAGTTPKRSHTIASGDTLSAISKRYGVDSQAILSANPGLDPRRLRLGAKVVIPVAKKK